MAYVKNYPGGWQPGAGGGTPITAATLDNIETQYDEAIASLSTSGSYNGDGTSPRAIAHGLGRVPVAVFIASTQLNVEYQGQILNRAADAVAISFSPGVAQTTIMDAINFYAYQGGVILLNEIGKTYYWVAI